MATEKSHLITSAQPNLVRRLTGDALRVRRSLRTDRIYPVFQPIVRLPSHSIGVMPDRRHVGLATIATARDENNEIVGLLVTLIDITEYKHPTYS